MGSGNGSWTTMNLLNSRIDSRSSIRSVMIPSASIARLLPHHSVSSRITPTTRPGVNYSVVIAIRRIRSSRIHRRTCRDVSRFAHSTIQRVSRTVLRTVPGSIGIVLFDDRRLLLNDLRLGARAGHSGAQEDVDDQHDQEENSESDAEVKKPQWLDPSDGRYGGQRRGSGVHNVDGI